MKLSREEIKARSRKMASIMQPNEDELRRLHKTKSLCVLSNQLIELGFDCTADGMEIVSIIDNFHVDTSKLSFPDDNYIKFRERVLAGDYDMSYSGELIQTDEQKKYIDDAVKSGKAHVVY